MSSEPESKPQQLLEEGLAHCNAKSWTEARANFEKVLALEPEHAVAWNNLGNVLEELGDVEGAYRAFATALAIAPSYASPQINLAITAHKQGSLLYAQGKLDQALQAFKTAALQGLLMADYDHSYLQLLLETCHHLDVTQHVQRMHERTYAQGTYYPHPYPLLAAKDDPAWHLLAAQRHLMRFSQAKAVIAPAPKAPSTRIRIAYLSSDWHQNPVPQQLVPVIEAHDRGQFEVIGVATDNMPDERPWRKRIEQAFDSFYALGHLTDDEVAQQLRNMDIDIAIDLSLYMEHGRPMILQTRPARLQVAMLGYAGTSGAPWIDYLIADDTVVPQHLAHFYSEKMIRLPRCFMPDHDQRPKVTVSNNRFAALAAQGLPESGFIFCAFSNPYKVTPEMLACWFRLLHAVPKSVLWLQANNRWTKENMGAAASAAGLTKERLVFAERVDSFADHLQRYALADLFLDTFPYNAHVTAADALWAGLPVLTLQGQSFASRVASSILKALDLPELITTDLQSYEAKALELARDAVKLEKTKDKLLENNKAAVYFDQTAYARDFENALQVAFKTIETTTKKLIAFSLWGDNSVYLHGALRNAELAARLYPDWICRFYCASDLAQDFLSQLKLHPNVEVILMPPKPNRGGAFWRFFAAEDPAVSHVLFRDVDSRLSLREAVAVREWMASGKDAHLMRDHPFHWPKIMAGMWGCKGGVLMAWQAKLGAYQPTDDYGSDQEFLADVIYPQIKARCVIHDALGMSEADLDVRPFPTPREGLAFVGQGYDANNEPNQYYEQELVAALHRL